MKTSHSLVLLVICSCSGGIGDDPVATSAVTVSGSGSSGSGSGAAPSHPCADHLGAKAWEGPVGGFQPCTGNLALELSAGPITLIHNSRDAANLGPAGYGVRLAIRDRLAIGGDGSVTRTIGDGETVVYRPRTGGGFDSPPDTQSTLTQSGSSYVIRMPENTRLTYTRPNGAAWILTSVQDRVGNTTTIAVDTSDHETSITDHTGNQTQLTWSGGRLATVTDAEGMVWSLQYDAGNQLIAIHAPVVDGATPTSTIIYDASHRILQHQSATGSLIGGYSYLADGSVASWTEPSGRQSTVSYGAGQVSVGDAFGAVTTYQFTAAGELAAQIEPSGLVSHRYTYDARHRVVTDTDWLNGVTAYQYNATDDVTRVTDRYGKATSYTYDDRHNALSVTDAAGKTTSYTYDANDQVLTIDDPSGRHETYQRAANGNLDAVIGSDGKTVASYVYGSRGEVLQERDADGRLTTYTYDAYLNTTSVTGPDGATTSYTSSRLGRPLSQTSPSGEVRSWTYDQAHRLVSTQYENNGTAAWGVDADGRLISVTSNAGPLPQTWAGAYTPDGRLSSTAYNGTVDQTSAAVMNVPQGSGAP